MRCWGAGANGRLGNGSDTDRTTPVQVTTGGSALDLVETIGVGAAHACAVRADDSVWCWGKGASGRLGNGGVANAYNPVEVPDVSASDVAAGGSHTCAALTDGTVSCWGAGLDGQLGTGGRSSERSPVGVPGLTGVESVAAGDAHSCAAAFDGALHCWGEGAGGRLGTGGTADALTPAAVGVSAFGIPLVERLEWDFDGDGAVDAVSDVTDAREVADVSVTHTYGSAGVWAPQVRAVGAGGRTGAWDRVEVGGVPVDLEAVTARATMGWWSPCRDVPLVGCVAGAPDGFSAQPFTFTAYVAAEAGVAEAEWDFDGNGVTDTTTPVAGLPQAATVSASHTFGTVGSFLPRVRVVDGTGAPSAWDRLQVVAGVDEPLETVAVTATMGWWMPCHEEGGACLPGAPDGSDLTSFIFAADAAAGTAVDRLEWDFDADGTVDATTDVEDAPAVVDVTATHTYLVEGTFYPQVRGVDTEGNVGAWDRLDDGGVEVGLDTELFRPTAQMGWWSPCHTLDGAQCLPGAPDGEPWTEFTFSADVGAEPEVDLVEWDFDGDGSVDETADVPDAPSLSGVTARHAYGREATVRPRVRAVDSRGNVGAWDTLGVGGLEIALDVVLPGPEATMAWWDPCFEVAGACASGSPDGFTSDTFTFTASAQAVESKAVRTVAAGAETSCAVLWDGTVRCWGEGSSGQVGDGGAADRLTPVGVEDLADAVDVAVGGGHACAALADGTVRCWGEGGSGQLGSGLPLSSSTPVEVVGLSDAVAVTAGDGHSCALLADGTARCWGAGANGRLGNGSAQSSTVPVAVEGLEGIGALSAGGAHTCALLDDGTARCWGNNSHGQLGNGSTADRPNPVAVSGLTGVAALAAGGSHTCAAMDDGTARCWGAGANGRLGNGATVSSPTPVAVTGLSGAQDVTAGAAHTCAALGDGTVSCWGAGGNGRLGSGASSDSATPVPVAGLPGVAEVAAGGAHACALLTDTTPRCWGAGGSGRLGDGTGADSADPVTPETLGGAGVALIDALEWDFDNDGTVDATTDVDPDAETVTDATATFAYRFAGSYRPDVRAVDVDGRAGAWARVSADGEQVSLDVLDVRAQMRWWTPCYEAPGAGCAPGEPDGGADTEFGFQADVDAVAGLAGVEWDFDGDGTVDTTTTVPGHPTSAHVTATHTYGRAGSFRPRVRALSATGSRSPWDRLKAGPLAVDLDTVATQAAMDWWSPCYQVAGLCLPGAPDGRPEQAFTLNADLAAPDGLAGVEWDVDGDGTIDETAQIPGAPTTARVSATHTYGTVGAFQPRVRPVDANGLQGAWDKLRVGPLTVDLDAGYRPPTATMGWWSPCFELPLLGCVPGSPDGAPDTAFTLTADGTGDLLDRLEWDFDGDGTVDGTTDVPDAESAAGVTTTHTYGTLGYWYPQVRSVDDHGTVSEWDRLEVDGAAVDLDTGRAAPSATMDWWSPCPGGGTGCEPGSPDGSISTEFTFTADASAAGATLRATDVDGGQYHSCAVGIDKAVWCWGYNANGQLGDGTTTNRSTPVQVSGLTDVRSVAGGTGHTCAARSDGTVWCWGYNANGQLGDGTTTNRLTPVQVSGLTDAVAISAGGVHTCALLGDGTARCWGGNSVGQLGDGTTTQRLTPVQVSGLAGVEAVAAGYGHTCAARTDGTARCWGDNTFGQLGDGTTTNRSTPVQVSGLTDIRSVTAGYGHTCAARTDGTARCWGRNFDGQLGDGTTTSRSTPVQVSGLSGANAVAGGDRYSCAARTDGTLWCWGDNGAGQLGDGTATDRLIPVRVGMGPVAAVGTGDSHACALRSDSGVWCWGYNGSGQVGDGTTTTRLTPVPVSGLVASPSVTAAYGHSCAARADGAVWCWGWNDRGQIGDGTTTTRLSPVPVGGLTGAEAVAGGQYHSCAVRTDGTVWCWGWNANGQLGDGTTTQRLTPVQVSGLSGATAVDAGSAHTCALRTDGTVWCWGWNANGQLGDGTTTTRLSPVPVGGLTGAEAVAGGQYHSCAVRTDGTVWCWGWNANGQLGDGTTTQRLTPVQVSGLTGTRSVAAGIEHSCAVRSDSTVWCWGLNGSGQLGDGTTTNRLTPVQVSGLSAADALAAGDGHTCAVRSDDTVRCWGGNWAGQLGDGTTTDRYTPVQVSGLSGARSVGAGGAHSCAALPTGTFWCWGENWAGQVGDGTTTDRYTPVAAGVTSPATRRVDLLQWDFDGNGSVDATTDVPDAFSVSGVTATHTYPSTGTYQPRVRAVDDGGLPGQWARLEVGGAPVDLDVVDVDASMQDWSPCFDVAGICVPGSPDGTTSTEFTLAAEVAADASVDRVEWDFDGDGTADQSDDVADAPAATVTATHTYATAGSFVPRVRAIDTGGTASAWDRLRVDGTPDTIDVEWAAATATMGWWSPCFREDGACSVGGGSDGTEETEFTLTADATGAPAVDRLEWDFDGDGAVDATTDVPDAPSVTGATATHTYGVQGSWQPQVRSVDTRGTQSAWAVLEVDVAGIPVRPWLDIGTLPPAATMGWWSPCFPGDGPCEPGSADGGADQEFTLTADATGERWPHQFTGIDANGGFTCAARQDGTARCWGANNNGQLGDGTTTERHSPVMVSGLSNVTQVSTFRSHACALRSDGTVWCWGANNNGNLGDGTTTDRYTPVQVSGLSGATGISAGYYYTCAVLSDGTARCWGSNLRGQLGDGTTTQRLTPVPVSGLTNAVSISTGGNMGHTCALLTDGTGRCWGYNHFGALGDGTTTEWHTPVPVSGLTNAVAISAGRGSDTHSCAVLSDGTARCWGTNSSGQLGDGTQTTRLTPVPVTGLSGAIGISAGGWDTCAVLTDGTGRCWGYNTYGNLGDGTTTQRLTPVPVSGLTNAVAISAGDAGTCSLLADGTARCWGRNQWGQVGDGTTTERWTPVAVVWAGLLSRLEWDFDGDGSPDASQPASGLSVTGATTTHTYNEEGSWQPGVRAVGNGETVGPWDRLRVSDVPVDLDTVDASVTMRWWSPCYEVPVIGCANGDPDGTALEEFTLTADATADVADNGGVDALEWDFDGDGTVDGTTDVSDGASVSGTATHTYGTPGSWRPRVRAVTVNGRRTLWDRLDVDGLEPELTTEWATPAATMHAPDPAPGLASNAVRIADGLDHTCAIAADRSVLCWGRNQYGQLGDGTTTQRVTPVHVSGLTDAEAVAGGQDHTCTLRADGIILCWGRNSDGQLGDGTTTQRLTPGQVSGITDAEAISAGYLHTCAVRTGGTVWCWGRNQYGALGDGTTTTRLTPVQVSGITNAVAVDAGFAYSCALRTDATMWCWGANQAGQLGDGTTTTRLTPVQVSGITNAVAISAGGFQACAVLSDRTARCWGRNAEGQVGDGTTTNRSTPVQVSGLTDAEVVAAGDYHTCAVRADGTAQCWGGNGTGQLGDGTTTYRSTPVQVSGLTGALSVTAGEFHTCAARNGGSAQCWGNNFWGQLGDGTTTERHTPVQVSGLQGGVAGTPFTTFTFTADATAELVDRLEWDFDGNDTVDETTDVADARTVAGVTATHVYGVEGEWVPQVRVIDTRGVVGQWSAYEVLGVPIGFRTRFPTPAATMQAWSPLVAAGDPRDGRPDTTFTFGADATAELVDRLQWDFDGDGAVDETTDVPNALSVAGVTTTHAYGAAGTWHPQVRVVDTQGVAGAWDRYDPAGVPRDLVTDWDLPTATMGAFSPCFSLPLLGCVPGSPDGRPWTVFTLRADASADASGGVLVDRLEWDFDGDGAVDATTDVPDAASVTGVTATDVYGEAGTWQPRVRAVDSAGRASAWDVFEVAGVALDLDTHAVPEAEMGWWSPCLEVPLVGCVAGSPDGLSGAEFTLSADAAAGVDGPVRDVTVGDGHACAVLSDGTLRCWGRGGSGQLGTGATASSAVPVTVVGVADAAGVSAGADHTCARATDGSVRCWGANGSGRLGDGTTTDAATPVAVAGLAGVVDVDAGGEHSCAVLAAGSVWCWGANDSGQLGNGSTTDSATPVAVSGVGDAVAVATGREHSCAVRADGSVSCWGAGGRGRLGNGGFGNRTTPTAVSGLTGVTGVTAGALHTCARGGDGSVSCWGAGSNGRLGTGTTADARTPVAVPGVSDVAAIDAGTLHTCAADGDGSVWCWGGNADGQVGDGTTTDTSTPVVAAGIEGAGSVAAGGGSSCALALDGAARCWGSGDDGLLGDGNSAPSVSPVVVNGPELPLPLVDYLEWDFDGDGTVDATTDVDPDAAEVEGATTTHTYAAGVWQPQVRAVDTRDVTGAWATVDAGAGPEPLDVVDLEATMGWWSPCSESDGECAAGSPDGRPETTYTFSADARGSVPVDALEWDFDGDGTVDATSDVDPDALEVTDVSVTHVYDEEGSWAPAVRAVAAGGGTSAWDVLDVDGAEVALDTVQVPPTATMGWWGPCFEVGDACTPGSPDGRPETVFVLSADVTGNPVDHVEWDVDGDGAVDAVTDVTDAEATVATYAHAYGETGSWQPAVRAVDAYGLTSDWDRLDVLGFPVDLDTAPFEADVTLTWTPCRTLPLLGCTYGAPDGTPGTTFTFAATASSSSEITSLEWDFDGDGNRDLLSDLTDAPSVSASVEHVYGAVGSYLPQVRAKEKTTLDVTAWQPAVVGGIPLELDVAWGAPTVTMRAWSPMGSPDGTASTVFTFTADATGGPAVDRIEWDFDDDGTPDAATDTDAPSVTGATVTHVYGAAGRRRPRVRAVDTRGNVTAWDRYDVLGVQPRLVTTEDPPVATMGWWSPCFQVVAVCAPGAPDGEAATTFTLSASATGLPAVDEIEWDFDGDGDVDATTDVPDAPSVTGVTTTHAYGEAGSWQPQVRAVSSGGLTGGWDALDAGGVPEELDTVQVKATMGWWSPCYRLAGSCAPGSPDGSPSTTFTFSASASGLPAVAEIEWDFDGDGTVDGTTDVDPDSPSVPAVTTTHVYGEVGSWQPRVRAVNTTGLRSAWDRLDVFGFPVDLDTTRAAATATMGAWSPMGSPDGATTTSFTFTADATGDPAVDRLEWDFNGDGTADEVTDVDPDAPAVSGVTVTHAYGSAGTWRPQVRAVDTAGVVGAWDRYDVVGIEVDLDTGLVPTVQMGEWSPSGSPDGRPETVFTFTADGTGDPAVDRLEWDFDGDGTADQVTDVDPDAPSVSGVTATHVYGRAGSWTPQVRSRDTRGTTSAWDRYDVLGVPVRLDVEFVEASATVGWWTPCHEMAGTCVPGSPDGTPDTTFTFTADATADPAVDRLEWDFDGDGTTDGTTDVPDAPSVTGVTATHVYGLEGAWTPRVRAVDSNGLGGSWDAFDILGVPVELDAGWPPLEARLTFSPRATLDIGPDGTTETAFSFDASGSTGGVGGLVEYRWDFDGDATVDQTTTGPGTTHTYPAPGAYPASVTVADSEGTEATATALDVLGFPETVDVRASNPPVATMGAWSPFEVLGPDGTPDTVFTLTADASGDRLLDRLEWDFDGDGAADATTDVDPDAPTVTGVTTTHVYGATGVWTPQVRAVDTAGVASAWDAYDVVGVTPELDTAWPALEARVTFAPKNDLGTDGTTVTVFGFDASAATGGTGAYVSYAWDFDGDGTPDETTTTPTTTHTYPAAGSYPAQVTVTDSSGAQDTARPKDSATGLVDVDVDVAEPEAPEATMGWWTPCHEVAGVCVPGSPDGGPATTFTFTADAQADLGELVDRLEWDFDGDGTADGTTDVPDAPSVTGVTATHAYGTPGTWTPKVRAVDAAGRTGPWDALDVLGVPVDLEVVAPCAPGIDADGDGVPCDFDPDDTAYFHKQVDFVRLQNPPGTAAVLASLAGDTATVTSLDVRKRTFFGFPFVQGGFVFVNEDLLPQPQLQSVVANLWVNRAIGSGTDTVYLEGFGLCLKRNEASFFKYDLALCSYQASFDDDQGPLETEDELKVKTAQLGITYTGSTTPGVSNEIEVSVAP